MTNEMEQSEGSFAENSYPADFLAAYEPLKCLAHNDNGETLVVRGKADDALYIAKLLPDGAGDESDLLEKLSHPALPRFVARFTGDGSNIIVREYVDGLPLDEVANGRALTDAEVVHIGIALCDALIYLHTRTPPIIHRDIKPQNVILCEDGTVKLIDFGISRRYKEDAKKDTVFYGTSDFAPPEQYGFSQTDARADIYSLGVLLRFLLTGGKGDDEEIENPRLRRTIARCTAFAPGSRFKDAQSVKRALEDYDGRRVARLYCCAAVLCALLVGLCLGRYVFPKPPSADMPETSAVQFVEPSIERAVRLQLDKPEGELYMGDLEGVTELYLMQDTPSVTLQEYYNVLADWYAGGRSPENGSVVTIEDVAMLKNLRVLCISANAITDISPIASCPALEVVMLKHGDYTDISAMEKLYALREVVMAESPIEDISPLLGKSYLTGLGIAGCPKPYRPELLAQMGDFDYLAISGNDEAFRHLYDKTIRFLNLRYAGIDSLVFLTSLKGLQILDVQETDLTDLAGIEVHTGLTNLNIAFTAITDLSPLVDLPKLTRLELSKDMEPYAAVLSGMEGLEIIYY